MTWLQRPARQLTRARPFHNMPESVSVLVGVLVVLVAVAVLFESPGGSERLIRPSSSSADSASR